MLLPDCGLLLGAIAYEIHAGCQNLHHISILKYSWHIFITMNQVLPGVDLFCLQADNFVNSRCALLTNDAAFTWHGTSCSIALLKAGFHIVKLFSPEHGLTAKGDDGAGQDNHIDKQTQLPVISLYGDQLVPAAADLEDIDCIIFDIPDVGCRFYTYLWTMTYMMEACATFNKRFIVLDRPNPAGADLNKSEGPELDEANCSSFIGRWNIPVRHCCTLGELALFFTATRIKNLDLQVIKAAHWNRKQDATAAGWHFVPTSPAIQDVETALLYPGMGLLEGIHVNEGRGTKWPFKIMGAPWIHAPEINHCFADLQLPGITSSAIDYTPGWGLFGGKTCHGLQFTVADAQLFEPVKTGIALLQLIANLYPDQVKERLYSTVANPSGAGHLDKLTGTCQSFEKLKNNQLLVEPLQKKWAAIMQPWLLY